MAFPISNIGKEPRNLYTKRLPHPGTTKMTRLKENIGSVNITLSDDDLANINKALDCISLQGERYPASLANLQGK